MQVWVLRMHRSASRLCNLQLSLRLHPDRAGGSTEVMAAVSPR